MQQEQERVTFPVELCHNPMFNADVSDSQKIVVEKLVGFAHSDH